MQTHLYEESGINLLEIILIQNHPTMLFVHANEEVSIPLQSDLNYDLQEMMAN